MDSAEESKKPKIIYPSLWAFAVIGADEEILRAGILAIVKERGHSLKFSHRSPTSKYCSFHVEMIVKDEAERNMFYENFRAIPTVKMVL